MSKKYLIQLFEINPNIIENKFGFRENGNIFSSKNTTKIENIQDKTVEFINFVDDIKRNRKCLIAMNGKGKNCFWCRHPIYNSSHCGIGCPVSHSSSILTKTYLSEISHDMFSIKEHITEEKTKVFQNNSDPRIKIDKHDYYETYGFFCSFNCCMAFIEDNKHDAMFVNSKFLLLKIYADYTNNIDIDDINPAPSWKLLSDYGGMLSIEEFRNSFNNIDYKEYGTYISEKKIGVLVEKNLRV